MRPLGIVHLLGGATLLAGLAAAGYATRDAWLPWVQPAQPIEPTAASGNAPAPAPRVILTDQAQANLRLTAKPLTVGSYWKTILVPGMVVDRPGRSDRGVVAPATGVVQSIIRLPGETVRPGEPLVTLRLLSESLQLTQTELYKVAQDVQLVQAKRDRLTGPGSVVPPATVREVDDQIARLQAAVKAYRQELLTRGLSPVQIDGAAEGRFVTELTVAAPRPADAKPSPATLPTPPGSAAVADPSPVIEVQELRVELGQQVQAGQTLCLLANHQALSIEGRAFRDETPFLERAVREGWPVEVDFQEPAGSEWPALNQAFHIRHLANTIDPVNRTFAFLLPLENQARTVDRDGRTIMLWRFRPGQKVRLHVPVEKLDNVFIVPADAVARDGPEAFVFTQNVNTFIREPVRVLLQDRQQAVLANDGSLIPGVFVAQTAAAQLNRMVKAQSNAGPKGYHVHADGSLHKNEDEGK